MKLYRHALATSLTAALRVRWLCHTRHVTTSQTHVSLLETYGQHTAKIYPRNVHFISNIPVCYVVPTYPYPGPAAMFVPRFRERPCRRGSRREARPADQLTGVWRQPWRGAVVVQRSASVLWGIHKTGALNRIPLEPPRCMTYSAPSGVYWRSTPSV